jgi:hypothetical protein
VVLAVPTLALFPIKLLALYLFSHGQSAWGLGLLIGAKIIGTAFVARLFYIVQPTLMQWACQMVSTLEDLERPADGQHACVVGMADSAQNQNFSASLYRSFVA